MLTLDAFELGGAKLRDALDLARVWRGHCGRREARLLCVALNRQVASIQSTWRGYWQRTHGGEWHEIKARVAAAATMVQRRFRKTILLRYVFACAADAS